MVVMANVISPYTQGRQPCPAFQEDRMNKARTCPRCATTVQWCRHCAQNHHSGGWETCPERAARRPDGPHVGKP